MEQHDAISSLLPGAWTFVSVVAESADGSSSEPFGGSPRGMMIFTADGHFSLLQSRAQVPRIARGDRALATPEEAVGIVASAIAYCGTYVIDEADRSLTLTLEASTLANLVGGAPQRRMITSLTPEQLRFTNPRTPAGVTLHVICRRAGAP